jgi:hypothetical protein
MSKLSIRASVRFQRALTPIPVNVWGVGYRLLDAPFVPSRELEALSA